MRHDHIQAVRNDEAGFTLVEIIIALTVVAILGAIAFPHIVDMRDDTEEHLCANNRSALADAIRLAYTQCEANPEDAFCKAFEGKWTDREGKEKFDALFEHFKNRYVCPLSKDFYVLKKSNLGFSIVCEEPAHNSTMYFPPDVDKFPWNNIASLMYGARQKIGKTNFTWIDSQAGVVNPTSLTAQVERDLRDLSAKPSDAGMKTWAFQFDRAGTSEGDGTLFWTTFDYNLKDDAGKYVIKSSTEKIPVLGYDTKTGTYGIWESTMDGTGYTQTGGGGGGRYRKIKIENTKPVAVFKNLSDAEEYYSKQVIQKFKDEARGESKHFLYDYFKLMAEK